MYMLVKLAIVKTIQAINAHEEKRLWDDCGESCA